MNHNKSFQQPNGCRAIKDNQLCGNKIFGRAKHKNAIKYCKKHVPSAATPHGGRTEPIQFYDHKNNKIITVE